MLKIDTCGCNTTTSINKNSNHRRLTAQDYNKPTTELATFLLGKRLLHKQLNGETLGGIVVETEAYPGVTDEARHSYGGKHTERTKAMFMDGGTAYVYFVYGMYVCMNVSSADEGGAVLLRLSLIHI